MQDAKDYGVNVWLIKTLKSFKRLNRLPVGHIYFQFHFISVLLNSLKLRAVFVVHLLYVVSSWTRWYSEKNTSVSWRKAKSKIDFFRVSSTNMNAKKTTVVTPIKSNLLPVPSIQLVIVCVSLAVALTMSALIIFVDVASPSLADIFLSPKYFPLGQGLQLRSRRWTKSKDECEKRCASKDENFRRFGGVQCGRAVWQSTADHGEGDRYVSRIDTLYKLFENSSAVSHYFNNYWTDRLDDSQALPLEQYFDETKISPQAGGNFRAFRWDPVTRPSGETDLPLKTSRQARHIHYIFMYVS